MHHEKAYSECSCAVLDAIVAFFYVPFFSISQGNWLSRKVGTHQLLNNTHSGSVLPVWFCEFQEDTMASTSKGKEQR